MGLDQQARFFLNNWQTPQSRDWKSDDIKPETATKHLGSRPLNEQATKFQSLRPGPPIPDGLKLSESDRTSHRHWQTPSLGMIRSEDDSDHKCTDQMGERGKFGNLLEQVSAETKGQGPAPLKSPVRGMADGLSDWLDGAMSNRTKRLGRLGNAVVPDCAEWIARKILEFDHAN
jgi:hypothetical protein